MKANLRAMIAYTAGCAISKTNFSYVFDQFQDRVIKLEGRFDNSYVTIIDSENDSEMMGTIQGKEISLYSSAENSHIKIHLNDPKFTGTISVSKGFNGELTDRIVKLYDYDEGKYYNFCLINEPGKS